jgi:DHA1 family bicyclomycin/chloramphenicol resistance-like MFS transporter
MMAFALVSGLVAPMLFGSAFRLACGVTVGLLASYAALRLAGLAGKAPAGMHIQK